MTWRTSNGLTNGHAVGSRGGRGLGRDLDGPLQRLDVDHAVAGQQLLGLGVRPVGDDGGAARTVGSHNELGLLGAGEALGVDQLAPLGQLGVEGDLEVDVGSDVLRLPLGDGGQWDSVWP